MSGIPRYSLIYYIDERRFQLSFSASSTSMFTIIKVRNTDRLFEDPEFTLEIERKVLGRKNKDLFELISEINEILEEDCMAFNHND